MDVESSSSAACLGMKELGLLNPKICRKLKTILKLKKTKIEDDEVDPAGPASSSSSENNYSMKLKFEATKRKLEQSYGEESEKKAKKKIQRIDDFPNPNNNLRCCSSSSSKVKALNDGDVRQRLLAKMKRLKKKNQKPKYCLYLSKPDIQFDPTMWPGLQE